MKKKYILFLFATLALTTSCDDWLDVRGENIQKEKDQYESYKGFRDALTGCYMEMANTDAYGSFRPEKSNDIYRGSFKTF